MRLLYASFEIRELCALLALVASANLMCLIVNKWVTRQDSKLSLENVTSIRHQMMASLDPNKASTGKLIDRRRIEFCNAVVLRASQIPRQFAMENRWRNCFIARNKLDVCHLIQKSPQFKSLNTIGKMLASNLENFSRGDNADLSLIVIFDKATNLFSPSITNSGIPDFDTERYVTLNCVLSCLKKLFICFFMLFTKSRMGKLLPPDILVKLAERENEIPWSNLTGRILLPSTSDQTDNLTLFPPFVSFRLDIEGRMRMLEPESRGKEFSKPMAGFSKPSHMSMFGGSLWFAYWGSDKLEEVAKWKLLGGGRHKV